LQLLPEEHRHVTNGLAQPTMDFAADAKRGHNSDVAILLSPSTRERLPGNLYDHAMFTTEIGVIAC
jgi:hypothetical protein